MAKVAIAESVISVGRPYTMANFADVLLEEGHDVTFFYFVDRHMGQEDYIKGGNFSNLSIENMCKVEGDTQTEIRKKIIEKSSFFDKVIFEMQYLRERHDNDFGNIIDNIDADIYFWLIIPHPVIQNIPDRAVILTNSFTTRNILRYKQTEYDKDNRIFIVHPPIDYSPFRENRKTIIERSSEIVVSTRSLTGKWDKKNLEWYKKILRDYDSTVLGQFNDNFVWNRGKVAKKFGDAKIYLSLSQVESASLAIYEALNAKCIPLVYWCGAALEQIGDEKFLIKTLEEQEIREKIDYFLATYDRSGMKEGMEFDRVKVKKELMEGLFDK